MVETNRYVEKVLDEAIIKQNSRFKEWKTTDFNDMKLFLGLLIHMGMLNLTDGQGILCLRPTPEEKQ